MTKIACASDIHGRWREINYPPADILIFAGDIFHNYNDDHPNANEQFNEAKQLNEFVRTLPYHTVVIIPGNHCWVYEKRSFEEMQNALFNMVLLNSTKALIHGLKFYGEPGTPWFGQWAYSFPRRDLGVGEYAEQVWNKIPEETEILVTHGPAYGIRDRVMDSMSRGRDPHVGCPKLRSRLNYLPNLKLHCVGHIHFQYGQERVQLPNASPLVVNASVCNEGYDPVNPIQVVEV